MHVCTVEPGCRLPVGHLVKSAVERAVLMRVEQAVSSLYSVLMRALNLSMHTDPEVGRVLFWCAAKGGQGVHQCFSRRVVGTRCQLRHLLTGWTERPSRAP